eukprot:CFRG0467T1
MPKAEVGTAKYQANKQKSKGLQRLKWFCQMCQKQCRDDNGFKCHIMSETHQRQMELFAENTDTYLDSFSFEFQKDFMVLLKRRFGTRRVMANVVYNEFIGDKLHTHMNSTKWETLTEFVKHLGKDGLCTVDETPKGWYIQYIDRDPRTIAKQEAIAKKERMALTDDERQQRLVDEQLARAKAEENGDDDVVEYTELQRDDDSEKVTVALSSSGARMSANGGTVKGSSSVFLTKSVGPSIAKHREREDKKRKPLSNLERIMEMDKLKKARLQKEREVQLQNQKEKPNEDTNWIVKRLIVKVINRKLAGGRYHKAKGEIIRVHDKYVAEIEMLDTGDVIKIDQAHLETVIPQIGGTVIVLNGKYQGERGMLESVDTDKFSASIRLKDVSLTIGDVQYEDFCKTA